MNTSSIAGVTRQLYYVFISLLQNNYFNLFLVFILWSLATRGAQFTLLCLFTLYNYTLFFSYMRIPTVPASLLVGFNNIHPPLLYACIILTHIIINPRYALSIHSSRFTLWLLILTMLLGGLWGLGNSSWGYLWVSDPIEYALLTLIVLNTSILHIFLSKQNRGASYLLLLCVITYLYTLRFGIAFSRHSFFNTKFLTNLVLLYGTWARVILFKIILFTPFFLFNALLIISLVEKLWTWVFFKAKGLTLFHMILFAYSIGWVKYRVNNLTFTLWLKNICVYYNFSSTSVVTYKFFLYFFKKKLLFFTLSEGFLYIYKCTTTWLILPAYLYSFGFIIIIISILKIYSR